MVQADIDNNRYIKGWPGLTRYKIKEIDKEVLNTSIDTIPFIPSIKLNRFTSQRI